MKTIIKYFAFSFLYVASIGNVTAQSSHLVSTYSNDDRTYVNYEGKLGSRTATYWLQNLIYNQGSDRGFGFYKYDETLPLTSVGNVGIKLGSIEDDGFHGRYQVEDVYGGVTGGIEGFMVTVSESDVKSYVNFNTYNSGREETLLQLYSKKGVNNVFYQRMNFFTDFYHSQNTTPFMSFDANGEATFHGAIDNNGLLHIENTSNINGLDAVLELVGRRDNSTTSLNSRIEFKNYDQHLTTNPTNFFGVITGQTNDAVNNFGDMVFYSSSDGLTLSESMRLTSTDSVVVASGKLFHVKGDGNVTGTPTIDVKIDGTVVFGGEDGSQLEDTDIADTYYSNFAVWVEHGLVAEDIAIAASTEWASTTPDYVFEDNYNLPTLKEVQTYIAQNGHLEDIPSKTEVAERGWSLPEMDQKLLKKVEELTLYTIEQENRINKLQKQVELLLNIKK